MHTARGLLRALKSKIWLGLIPVTAAVITLLSISLTMGGLSFAQSGGENGSPSPTATPLPTPPAPPVTPTPHFAPPPVTPAKLPISVFGPIPEVDVIPELSSRPNFPKPQPGQSTSEWHKLYKAFIDEEKKAGRLPPPKPSKGPATMGTTITVKGRSIQLPSDAYISGGWDFAIYRCDIREKGCIPVPNRELTRGDSTVWVSQVEGKIGEFNLAPGEEDAFDFLCLAVNGAPCPRP